MAMTEGFIPKHGGYRTLASYKKAEIVYDATVDFCEKYIDRFSRTKDQMIQAARSGKQNIIEGTMASGTSKETEIKLINVARASLEELLADYYDFLRTKDYEIWDKDSKAARAIRKLGADKDAAYKTYKPYIKERSPQTVANIIICLVHQANYLLDQQIRRLEEDFVKHGGLRERMYNARLKARKLNDIEK
jgi:four helix bundle suffix protein